MKTLHRQNALIPLAHLNQSFIQCHAMQIEAIKPELQANSTKSSIFYP
jgi:hypothetical protein